MNGPIEDDLAHFGHSVNYAAFFGRDEHDGATVLSIGSKMTMGHNEGRAELGRGSVVITEAARRGELQYYKIYGLFVQTYLIFA